MFVSTFSWDSGKECSGVDVLETAQRNVSASNFHEDEKEGTLSFMQTWKQGRLQVSRLPCLTTSLNLDVTAVFVT